VWDAASLGLQITSRRLKYLAGAMQPARTSRALRLRDKVVNLFMVGCLGLVVQRDYV
jgi:hypothetical protein